MLIKRIKSMKGKEKIVMLTAYDYCTAKILEQVGIDIILVGDSLGMVVFGYKTTKEVTLADMTRHTRAISNGAKNTLIVSDMPYKSDITQEIAIKNARILLENGAHAIKIEGKPDIVKAVVKNKINVMGHVGLLPQSTEKYRMVGKDEKSASEIFKMAIELERVGCFSIVLELIPSQLAEKITRKLKIPTIGIGAGHYCDGQVLVINDMLGMYQDIKPSYVKRYANIGDIIRKSVLQYKREVKDFIFPRIR